MSKEEQLSDIIHQASTSVNPGRINRIRTYNTIKNGAPPFDEAPSMGRITNSQLDHVTQFPAQLVHVLTDSDVIPVILALGKDSHLRIVLMQFVKQSKQQRPQSRIR